MTTQNSPVQAAAAPSRVAATLVLAAVVTALAAVLIAQVAILLGADASFAPLMPYVCGPLAVVGFVAAYVGWRIVRTRARNPRGVLAVVVPVLLVLSFVPDIVTAIIGFIPGGSPLGYAALMLMHPLVVALAVPTFLRVAPLPAR